MLKVFFSKLSCIKVLATVLKFKKKLNFLKIIVLKINMKNCFQSEGGTSERYFFLKHQFSVRVEEKQYSPIKYIFGERYTEN